VSINGGNNLRVTKDHITQLLNQYKRKTLFPFVIEVLGTPNSGKTSAIQTFEKILKRNGIKHKIIYEAASRCKIKNKLSPEFNLWTLNDTIKQLLEAYSESYDIVVCERGLLDSICWHELYYRDNNLTDQEFRKIRDYILLKRFTKPISCCYIMKCSVQTSIKRENLSGLLDTTGTIVNDIVLPKYNAALTACKENYGGNFGGIIELDTSETPQTDINSYFISSILEFIENQLL